MKWIDYRYSPTGHELYSYGPEGVVVDIDENGNFHNTDFVLNNPNGFSFTWLVFIYAMLYKHIENISPMTLMN